MPHRFCRTDLHSRENGFSFMELVVVLAVLGTIAAVALPVMTTTLAAFRLNGAARGLSNATAVAKTKGASQFTRARLFADLAAASFRVETWNTTTNQWDLDGSVATLPVNVTFGVGAVPTPPANTQPALGQAPPCLDGANMPIANTACIVFNSRGIPVDAALAPTASDALYITDGTTVEGVTVAATGLIGLWSTPSAAVPRWTIS